MHLEDLSKLYMKSGTIAMSEKKYINILVLKQKHNVQKPGPSLHLLIIDTCHLLTTTFKYRRPLTEPVTTLPTPLRHQNGAHL